MECKLGHFTATLGLGMKHELEGQTMTQRQVEFTHNSNTISLFCSPIQWERERKRERWIIWSLLVKLFKFALHNKVRRFVTTTRSSKSIVWISYFCSAPTGRFICMSQVFYLPFPSSLPSFFWGGFFGHLPCSSSPYQYQCPPPLFALTSSRLRTWTLWHPPHTLIKPPLSTTLVTPPCCGHVLSM